MPIQIKFSDIKKDFKDFKSNLKDSIAMAAQSSLLEIQTTAKSPGYVPVKTGNLKRSITHEMAVSLDEKNGTTTLGSIGSNLEYARIQEFGGQTGRNKSVFIQGRLYITRAIEKNRKNLERRLAAIKLIKRK